MRAVKKGQVVYLVCCANEWTSVARQWGVDGDGRAFKIGRGQAVPWSDGITSGVTRKWYHYDGVTLQHLLKLMMLQGYDLNIQANLIPLYMPWSEYPGKSDSITYLKLNRASLGKYMDELPPRNTMIMMPRQAMAIHL